MKKTLKISSTVTPLPAAVLNSAPRIAELRFDRQLELEAMIGEDPYTSQLVESYMEAKDYMREDLHPHGFILPQVGGHAWITALFRVRQRLRLSIGIRVIAILNGDLISNRVQGIEHAEGIDLIVPQRLLEDANETELAYHFGLGIWNALDPKYHAYREILRRGCPICWGVKMLMLEWMRFSQYAAACYGYLVCGDLETAIGETWRQCICARGLQDMEGLLALSESYCETGHLPPLIVFQRFLDTGVYLVGLPKVLSSFSKSAPCRVLLGEKLGDSRTEFQQTVSNIDKALYGTPRDLDEDFVNFLFQSTLFTRAFILEKSSDYSAEALFEYMDKDQLNHDEFIEYVESWGLNPEDKGDAILNRMLSLKDSPHAWTLQFLAHDILVGCFVIMIHESLIDPDFKPLAEERMETVLQLCGVNEGFAEMLLQVTIDALTTAD